MIKAGSAVHAKRTINLSVSEDEAPLLVIKEGDRLIATDEADAQGYQTFVHLPSQFENIRLHKDDVSF